MTEQLKRRLIGTSVLVALAAIFIPMLFDGGEQGALPALDGNIPAAPTHAMDVIEIPLHLPSRSAANETQVAESSNEVTASGRTATVSPEAPPATSAPAPSLRAETPSSVATAPRTGADKPARVVEAAKPKPAAVVTAPQVWAVQLGSFSQSANATALRDKARGKGFAAYVEPVKVGGVTTYRVRIGPESRREDADRLLQQIKTKLGVAGKVMPHP